MGIHKRNFKSPEQIPPELSCSLCSHIFLQPYQVLCRHDHVFCKACLDKYLDFCTREQQQQQSSYQPQQTSSSHGHHHGHRRGIAGASDKTSLPPTPIQKGFSVECPECKKSSEVMSGGEEAELLRVSSFRPAKFVERMVQAQSVHCPTTMTMWCHWTGPLRDTEEHLESCNFAFEHTCAYRYLGCGFKGGAMDVATHVKHCTFQASQPSYSTSASSSNRFHNPSTPSHHQHHQQFPQSSLGTRHQVGATSRGQGPMSPPQSSPPVPTVPPPAPHPYHRPMAQRTGAHPGHHPGHLHHHQPNLYQQPPLYFHTPVVLPSVPSVPTPPLPPTTTTTTTVVESPLESVGSYDVSQDFEQLSIDEVQRALDAELEDATDDDGFALYSLDATATATARMDNSTGGCDEEFVQVEWTTSMVDMEISDMAMSPTVARNSLPPETQEAITQQLSQGFTQVTQEIIQPANEAVPQQVISTQESASLISPIITQQIQEEALMIQCGQRMNQGVQETPQETQNEVVQKTAQDETIQKKQPQEEEAPQVQAAQDIPVSDLPTLSPQMRHRLSPSPSPPRDHSPPENDLPPARRRRIIVDEEESNRGSGDMTVDGDFPKDLQLLEDRQGQSSAAGAIVSIATAHGDQIPRRSITYTRQGQPDKSSRILRDITDAWVASRDERPLAPNHPRSTSTSHSAAERSSTSPSSARPGPDSGLGLAAEVFHMLNQNQFHQPHHPQQQDQQPSRRRSSEPGQRSLPGKSPVSRRRSSGRFNPLPMRAVPSIPPAVTTASSPLMQSLVAASPAHESSLASPPASSSDDEAEPTDQAHRQQSLHQQQQLVNPELANFLALTQNPPAHLIAEAEPQAFVPFVAYKPRYLKSRRKKGKAGRTYGLPIVRDRDAHDRYQNLVPPILTPDITSPDDSIASQADRYHDN